ncbi:DUF2382 domain-containing protein [Fortiea contorta]|uniref:DUF2382 domain-containing protein n=1 Tax=Fortiea contorta TaxID=1892405 RepID=UPI000345989E|nr:DUF2382 domain-containing protein [Fortiea contorta]
MPEHLQTTTPGDRTISAYTPEQNSEEKLSLAAIDEETIIKLLEERLVVNHQRQKIGDVIVRKVIETRIVEVPVRREKLIVEQVGSETKQLAEIDLGLTENSSVEITQDSRPQLVSLNGNLTVRGVFSSPKIASLLLNAIALEQNHGCQQIQLTIAVENQQQQQKYQEWFNRCSHSQQEA